LIDGVLAFGSGNFFFSGISLQRGFKGFVRNKARSGKMERNIKIERLMMFF